MVLAAPVLKIFNPSCFSRVRVDAGEADFEENLQRDRRDVDIEEIDDFAGCGGYLDGTVGVCEIFHCSAEDDEIVLRGNVDIFRWQSKLKSRGGSTPYCRRRLRGWDERLR